MPYLISIFVLLVISMVLSLRVRDRLYSDQVSSGAALREIALLSAPIWLIGLPMILQTDFVWAAWMIAAGALMGLSAYGWRLLRQRNADAGVFAIGANVFGLLICSYIVFAVVDQAIYYGDSADSGVMNWSYIKKDGAISDVQCDFEWMVVKGVNTQEVTYRCPTSVMFGRNTAKPFVPWPSYTEGTSKQLAKVLQNLLKQ